MKRIVLAVLLSFAVLSASAQVVEHRVKWYETIGTISAKYGVPADTILHLNGLSIEEVKARTVLQIPLGAITAGTDGEQETDTSAINPDIDSITVEEFQKITYSAENPLKVSLVLPFRASGDHSATNYLDFYSGALVALAKMKSEGVSVRLNVFDSEAYPGGAIFSDSDFMDSDLIIGPVMKNELKAYADFAGEHNIPIVSPMDQAAGQLADGNPYFFQVPVSGAQQLFNMANSLYAADGEKIMVFFDSSMKEQKYLDEVLSNLDSCGVTYSKYGYGLLSGRNLSERLSNVMSTNVRYKAVVASEDDAFAPDVVRNMRVMKMFSVPVELYCSNRVRNFESIDPETLYELSAHVYAPYFIDYNNGDVKEFLLKYRGLFNTEPTPFAFQGYDIFTFFITNLYALGSDFMKQVPEIRMELLQCNMQFTREDEKSGWHNCATRDIIYNEDLTISVERPDQD